MIVTSKNLFKIAQEQNFAIPATNFIDNDSARVYTETAEKLGLPLILAFAQSHRDILSLEEAATIGKYYASKTSTPIVLHLDHGEDADYIFKAIDLGFSSVMIDASMEDFADNLKITQEVVEYAHSKGVVVEAELGHVGANDTSEAATLTDSIYTEVADVLNFVEETNVDSLAISIGTAHGLYKGTPKINFDRLDEIAQETSVPLVLHGGSSSGDNNLKRCAKSGITKINIYSDFLHGAFNEIKKDQPPGYVELKNSASNGMRKVLKHYFKVFNTKPIDL